MPRTWRTHALVGLMVLVVTLMHYNTAIHIHAAHGIYRRLYYFPIIISAFHGGRRAGLVTSLVVCLVYIPHAFGAIGFDPAPTLEKVLEMVLYVAVGLVAGILADRERSARSALQATLDERARLERELIRRERLAAIGTLSAGLAHEIRNPLASIKGAADMLTPASDDDASPRTRMLTIIREESRRLNEVLTRFLAFARPVQGDRETCELGDELQRLAEMLRHGEPAVRVELERPERPIVVDANRDHLRQMLLNLGLNAAGMGSVVHLAVAARGDQAEVTVTDDGPGFSPEALSNLGTPFFSTRDGGTGLGLATAIRVAQDHGGTLSVDPRHRGGARVRVTLPLQRGDR